MGQLRKNTISFDTFSQFQLQISMSANRLLLLLLFEWLGQPIKFAVTHNESESENEKKKKKCEASEREEAFEGLKYRWVLFSHVCKHL